MTRFAAILAPALLAAPALAEPIAIRSGDHANFVRLVLSIPVGSEWRVGRSGAGLSVIVDGAEDGFDTSDIFPRIDRSRIGDVQVQGNRLDLALNCDCHADAFLWRDDRLVVDVVAGPAPAGSPFDAPIGEVAQAQAEATPEPREPFRLASPIPILPERTDAFQTQLAVMPDTFIPEAEDPRIQGAEAAILNSIARAATEGFFDIPTQPVPQITGLSEVGDGEMQPIRGLTPVTRPMQGMPDGLMSPENGGPGIALRTGLTDAMQPAAIGTPEAACMDDGEFAVHEWGGEGEFGATISELRSGLTGEFDRYNAGAIDALGRAYISYGFGIEARQVLRLDGEWTPERRKLDAMAEIVDGGTSAVSLFAGQERCVGAVALWAALAAGTLEQADDTARDAAVRAFQVLPPPLRGHIGVQLAQLFADAGEPERASDVLAYARNDLEPDSPEAAHAEAELSGVLDGPVEEIQQLEDLAEDSARLTPAALTDLLRLMHDEGLAPDDRTLELAEVHMFETRRSDARLALGEALTRGYIARSRFDDAARMLEETGFEEAETETALRSEILSAQVDQLDDLAFLDLAFAGGPGGVSAAAENAMGARLIDLGFPDRALSVMSGAAVRADMAERRYLRASAHAALGDVEGVEIALSGVTDDRAQQIRAQAHAYTGNYAEVLSRTLATSAPPDTEELAWKAGAMALLETAEDPMLRDVSRSTFSPTELAPDRPDLAARQALLDESAETRALLGDLLERFSIDDPDETGG